MFKIEGEVLIKTPLQNILQTNVLSTYKFDFINLQKKKLQTGFEPAIFLLIFFATKLVNGLPIMK